MSVKGKFLAAMLAAMMGCLTCFAGKSLVIHLKDGTVVLCSLAKEPQMAFGEQSITLSSQEGTVGQWDFSDVDSWSFSDQEDNAIDNLKQDGAQIVIEDGRLTVTGKLAANVAVYDMGGRLVTPSLSTSGNTTSMSLSGFQKGAYLLKVGKSSVKFMVP